MRDYPNSIMIFAAGRGTRMGDLVADRPKPLIPVAGKPLIDHALEIVNDAPIETRVVNLHFKGAMLVNHLASKDIIFSDESDHLLETGGGLRRALPLLGSEPVFTLNPDAIWRGDNPLKHLAAKWDPDRMDGLLMLVSTHKAHAHPGSGDFSQDDPDGPIERGKDLVYTGAQIIRTEELAYIQEAAFSLNLLWERMLKNNRLFGTIYDGDWVDVGTPSGITVAEEILAQERRV